MKPPPFAYADPETLDEALGLLGQAGDDAVIIAGGQSLIPLLNLRLARPELVIDPRRITHLKAFEFRDDGLRAGAMAKAIDIEEHPALDRTAGLGEALRQIGHVQIRARTTIGGSVAHADPAAELPALLLTLDGEVIVESADGGERIVQARDFFIGPLSTDRRPDELVTSVWFPTYPGSVTVLEVVKRPGDFAMVGAIVGYALTDTVITDPRITLFGVAGRAVRIASAESVLAGAPPGPEVFAAAADRVREEIEPTADAHASSDYRRHVAALLVERALVSLV